ncbi:MAG: response regulator transcription factor [Anaerolineae bacterium]|nr:response regulator transcription factor [Anaerolineae bacterium]
MGEAILVVGDHSTVRKALRERLEMTFPRYQVVEAAGSQEAEAVILSTQPCLVVLDIDPSAADRLEVIQRIKSIQPLAKIVVWSVHDWHSYRTDALAAGATAYVIKEGAEDKLLTVMSAML